MEQHGEQQGLKWRPCFLLKGLSDGLQAIEKIPI